MPNEPRTQVTWIGENGLVWVFVEEDRNIPVDMPFMIRPDQLRRIQTKEDPND